MKKNVLLCGFLLIGILASAKVKVIENPAYESRKTGLEKVTKIELTDTATRVTLHCTFLPGWWMKYSKKTKIYIAGTGIGYTPISMEGTKMGEKLWMARSGNGDTTIVINYPPIAKHIRKLDMGSDDERDIFGISLRKSASKNKEKNIPEEVNEWLNESLADVPRQEPIDFSSELFFNADTAHLRGYIKGYDKRFNIGNGIVYMTNVITDEDYPTVIKLYPDGRFESDLYCYYPQWQSALINDEWIPMYLEPGQTTVMILDWEDFLKADRYRDRTYCFKNSTFRGPLAEVNKGINDFYYERLRYKYFKRYAEDLTPEEFLLQQQEREAKVMDELEAYASENRIVPLAKKLLTYNVKLDFAEQNFSYIRMAKNKPREVELNKGLVNPISDKYYSFIGELPVDDRAFMVIKRYSTFINRLRFCEPIRRVLNSQRTKRDEPEINFYEYLLKEDIALSKEDSIVLSGRYLLKTDSLKPEDAKSFARKLDSIRVYKFGNEYSAYNKKYVKPLKIKAIIQGFQNNIEIQDSVMRNHFGIGNTLTSDIITAQGAVRNLEYFEKDYAKEYLHILKSEINSPFVVEEIMRIYKELYHEEENEAYELPEGEASDIFKKIIDQFKGKVLFVDFWATSCGPCVGGIKRMKEMRDKYADNPNFEFVFITDERSSPVNRYNKFVKEQGLKNTFRLTKSDFYYLRQLFKFNGIPHYALIDSEGRVLDDDYHLGSYSFERDLAKYELIK